MLVLFWDASALAKRYVPELGRQTVAELFLLAAADIKIVTTLGYAEVYSILLRRRNRREIREATFRAARTVLRSDIAQGRVLTLLSLTDSAIFAGLSLMDRYNLNATDASFLALVLQYRDALPSGSPTCLLVAADQRLVAAARGEGLAALNPETVAAADVSAFLAFL